MEKRDPLQKNCGGNAVDLESQCASRSSDRGKDGAVWLCRSAGPESRTSKTCCTESSLDSFCIGVS